MHVKRLYRPTVREALAAARQELGPRALVLSTEMVPAHGWRGWIGQRVVRLTAAAERPVVDETAAQAVSEERTGVSLNRHVNPSKLTPAQAGIAARLVAAGLSMTFAESVAARMTQAECRGGSEAALRRALSVELENERGDDDGFARFEVFVGPPGVGKTTTIAKIAAQERAGKGRPLNLIAADGFRVGAIEQLRSYASVIGVPFRVARSAAELDKTLGASRLTAFVDTAGRSPADPSFAELFAVLASRKGVRTHLVMAADTSVRTAGRILERYSVLKPSRVVFTKIDETDSILPLFNLVHERGLPMSYLAAGQRVPEDLQRATPAALAAALLHDTSEAATCH